MSDPRFPEPTGPTEATAHYPRPLPTEGSAYYVRPLPADDRDLDAGRLWAGGIASGLVAALVAVVGILVARGVLRIAVLAPEGAGTWGNANTTVYALVAAVAALGATALMQGLVLTTPQATQFFGWIIGLATVVAAVVPFTVVADQDAQIATALINLAIGVAILSLVSSVARSARQIDPRRY